MRKRSIPCLAAFAVLIGTSSALAQTASDSHVLAATVGGPVGASDSAPAASAPETAESRPADGDAAAPTLPSSLPATAAPGGASGGGAAAPIQAEQIAVPGSSIAAGRARTEVHAPYATVSGVVTDFAHFRDFFPQMRESRVIHRRRGQADVYIRVELSHSLGSLWALSRFNVTRNADSTVVEGSMVDGNLRRLDVRFEVRPIAGDASRADISMQILGVPGFFFPDGMLSSQQARWASRALELLRARAEALAEPQAALR